MIKIKTVDCEACLGTGKQPDQGMGPLLKAERVKLGIGLRQMERAMDISRTYLVDMERGSRRMSNKMALLYREQLEALTNGHTE
jgi:hypothetical protein